MKESHLITQIRTGNRKGFKELYRYLPVVKKWLVANGCSKQDAQDIYQKALLVFCEKCQDPEFTLTSSLETYLFSVSKFMWYNQSRKERSTTASDFSEIELAASNDVDEAQEKEEKLGYAFKALAQLSDRCRTILKMFYLNKKSMAEIAKKLGFKSELVAKNQKYKCLNYAKQKAFNLLNS